MSMTRLPFDSIIQKHEEFVNRRSLQEAGCGGECFASKMPIWCTLIVSEAGYVDGSGFGSHGIAVPVVFCSKLCNPFRVDAVVLRIAPGCAARPRALLLDCFAVTQTISTNPKRGLTSKPMDALIVSRL